MAVSDNRERNARIIELADHGKGPAAIARELGLTPGVVLCVLHRARKVGPKAPTQPVAVTALLATLVLIFVFQADNILNRPLHVALIALPILLQVYFNAALAYGMMRWLGVPYPVAAPGALIGASNFFELAVAPAIALYGPESGAALATVVGVMVEVPVMLSVCAACNRTRGWFPADGEARRGREP
jgi:ACR3 family arsenite efflux pump ArsB